MDLAFCVSRSAHLLCAARDSPLVPVEEFGFSQAPVTSNLSGRSMDIPVFRSHFLTFCPHGVTSPGSCVFTFYCKSFAMQSVVQKREGGLELNNHVLATE